MTKADCCREAPLAQLPLGIAQVLFGLQQHQLLGQHRLLADSPGAQLRLLATEQLLVALVNLLESIGLGLQIVVCFSPRFLTHESRNQDDAMRLCTPSLT